MGQTLLISGEPGIGKPRLMREVVTQSEVSGRRALVGEAYAESSTPYGAFVQMVRKVLDSEAQNGLKLLDFVLDDVLDFALDQRLYYPGIGPNPDLEADSEQTHLFENIVSFCNALCEVAPLLLVLDNAHWADSSSIALFLHLVRRTKKQPIMLLAACLEVELSKARATMRSVICGDMRPMICVSVVYEMITECKLPVTHEVMTTNPIPAPISRSDRKARSWTLFSHSRDSIRHQF